MANVSEAEIVRRYYVRHLSERLRDDGLLHSLAVYPRRMRCDTCRAIVELPIRDQLALVVEARELVDPVR